MARTFINQASQVGNSESYNDTLAPGSALQTNAVTVQDDLNALRSQLKQLSGDQAWFSARSGRSLAQVSTDLGVAETEIDALQAGLSAEEAARAAADLLLQGNIDSEASKRASADTTLQANINAEASARASADSILQGNIDNEASARASADSAIQSALTTEISERKAADSGFAADLLAEASARADADAALQLSLDTEVSARKSGDMALGQMINTEIGNRQSADVLLQSNIDGEASARAAADALLQASIDNEAATRAQVDAALNSAIQAEIARAEGVESALAADITSEQNRALAAESLLQSNIDAEGNARVAADVLLQSNIDGEAATRSLADSLLQSNIDNEAATRAQVDAALNSAIQAEVVRAEGAESALDVRLSTAENDIVDLDSNKLSRDGAQAMTGALNMGSFGIGNLADPTLSQDAATKAYVDSLVTGLKLHEPVRARMDIAGGTFPGPIADGVQLVTGDRVFVVDSQDATFSGIYVATVSGQMASFARAADFAAGEDVDGAFFFCQQGDTYADTSWVQTSSNLVDAGPLSFSMMFSPGDYQAGAGLDLVNKTFSVEPEGIVSSMLASSSVSEGKIADLAVSESKLAAASVSTGKIADLAVTETKLAASSVSTGKIADLAVTEGKIAAASVTQAKLSLVAPVANLDAATKLYVDERGFGSKVRLVVEGGLYASLQAAVDAAVANDVILVGPKASGDWGNVSFPTDKRLAVSALAGTQEQKIVKIGTVTFDTSGGAGNVNNNEVYLSGLHITGAFSTQAVLFQGTAPARLRMSNCYVYNTGSGDGIVNNNAAANSSLYLDSVLAQSSSTTGTVLKHTKGYTFIKNRSMFEGGLYAASCAAGVVEAYDSSFSMSGAREAVLVSGGLMTLGYSTIQNTNTGSSAIGVNVTSPTASFGAGDSTISVGGLAGAAGKAVSGSGYYSFGNVTYGFSSSIGASVVQVAAARTGGTFTTALSMSSNKITSLGAPTADTDAAHKLYVDTQAALKLSLSGGTMSGAIAMGGKPITNLLNPVNAQDAATKAYVDAAVTDLDARAGKSFSVLTVDVAAGSLVSLSSQNIDAALPVMPADAAQFNRQFDVFLNGQLQRPGANFDVLRDQSNNQGLVFGMPLYTGDTICVVSYT